MIYDELRGKIRDRFSEKLSILFTKSRAARSRERFESATHGVRLVVAVSPRLKANDDLYWYVFNQPQIDFLNQTRQGYFIIVFSDSERAFAIPHEKMNQMAKEMHSADYESGKKSRKKYHFHIRHCKDRKFIILSSTGSEFEFLQYEF